MSLEFTWKLKRIITVYSGLMSLSLLSIVVVFVVFAVFVVCFLFDTEFSSVSSPVSIILVSSSSSGIEPHSLSRVSILCIGFPVGTFVIFRSIGTHHVGSCVEFLLGNVAQ